MDKKDTLIDIDSPTSPAPRSRKKASGELSSIRSDGYQSALKGMGTARDFRTSVRFTGDALLPKVTLSDLYINDGLVRRIVDLVPDEIFRVEGSIQNDPIDKYDEGLIKHELNAINGFTQLKEAKKMSRLTGGSLLFIGAMGAGAPDTPLDISKITTIEFLKVYDLNDIQTSNSVFDTDPDSPNFGKIELYRVKDRAGNTFTERYLHYTRCIPFYGSKVPPSSAYGSILETRYWGTSILQYMYHDIFDYRTAFGNTAGILGEFVVGKYKFADLDDILASGNEKKLQSRMAGIEMSKSLINAVMLGTDEEYSRDSASVSGLSDLLDRFMMTVAAATGYPVTKLFGRSASGLNATGEGDQKAYYDMLRAEMVDLQPEIQYLIDIFVIYLGLPEGDYTFKFGNLYQPTAHEEADLERVKAETLRTSMDAAQRAMADGVLTPEQVYNLYYKKLLQDEPWQEPEPDDSAMEGVDDEAIISGQPVPPQETDDSESKNDELEEAISLEIPLESREGIIKRIAKALFGNSK